MLNIIMPELEELKEPEQKTVEHSEHSEQIDLPAYPQPIFEIGDEQLENLRYKGDMDDIEHRMRHKLTVLWYMWAHYRNSERLFDLIREKHEPESDLFFACNTIVNILDQVGRALSLTDLVKELLPNVESVTDVESVNDASTVSRCSDEKL